jgi:uncharacterized protein (DUF1330 family)
MKYPEKIVLFIVVNLLFGLISSAQQSTQPGTLIKHSQFENYFNLGNNLIKVDDFDNDSQNEIAILAVDTLLIIDSTSILYLQAFNSAPVLIPVVSMEYCPNTNGQNKIISYHQESFNSYWSYYYPSNNSIIFGSVEYSWLYSFTPDLSGNIWSVEEIDTLNYWQDGIFSSQEFFSNPSLVTLVGQDDSSMSYEFAGQYGSPPTISISSSNQYISTVLIRDNIFTNGNPHGIYHYYSTDFGSSWLGEIVLRGNIDEPQWGQISNRNLAPYLSYNSMVSGAIDDFGVMHLALWGYGKSIEGSDTTEITAIVYWNSKEKNWIAITDPDYEKMVDGVGNSLSQYSPAHFLGQSNPTIAVSEDGQIVMIAWCVPEYVGEPGISSLNIYPGDGGQYSTPIYYTDYLSNISYDGGLTWSESNIFPLKNRPNIQEVYLSLNKNLIYNESTGDYRADYFYIVDEIPGNAQFNQNSFSNANEWYYDSLLIQSSPVSVKKETIYSFSILQNFPNPFNPSTTISYEIPERNFVTLKVYDILGNEIAILVNQEKQVGKYKVEFTARDLSSGVYFYSLSTGNYFSTKKMILLC